MMVMLVLECADIDRWRGGRIGGIILLGLGLLVLGCKGLFAKAALGVLPEAKR